MAYARNRVPSMQRESGVRKLIERTTRHRLDSRDPGCICGDVTRACTGVTWRLQHVTVLVSARNRTQLQDAAAEAHAVSLRGRAADARSGNRGEQNEATERDEHQSLDGRRCGDHLPVESLAARSM